MVDFPLSHSLSSLLNWIYPLICPAQSPRRLPYCWYLANITIIIVFLYASHTLSHTHTHNHIFAVSSISLLPIYQSKTMENVPRIVRQHGGVFVWCMKEKEWKRMKEREPASRHSPWCVYIRRKLIKSEIRKIGIVIKETWQAVEWEIARNIENTIESRIDCSGSEGKKCRKSLEDGSKGNGNPPQFYTYTKFYSTANTAKLQRTRSERGDK